MKDIHCIVAEPEPDETRPGRKPGSGSGHRVSGRQENQLLAETVQPARVLAVRGSA